MLKQITSISIHQTSKVVAILYFVVAAIFCIPLGFFGIFSGHGEGAFAFLLIPFLYLAGIYILTALLSWLYNKIAAYFGGIEITVQDQDK